MFIAIGAPALVMFQLGGVSALTGTIAPLVWTVSVLLGFIECFTYTEIAGLHPSKSGGTSVFGATAWARYSKFIAPISPWANWLAWMPILGIGSGLAAGYLVMSFIPADHALQTWRIVLADLSALKPGLTIRVDLQFIVAMFIMIICWTVQSAGIQETAKAQIIFTLGGMLPLVFVALVPLFLGNVDLANFKPFVPLNGSWNAQGWHLFFGGLFLVAWSTYGFETAVSYMSEFKNPGLDAPKAVFWSGIIAIGFYAIVPFVFQGVLGSEYMLTPELETGEGVGVALAGMIGAGSFATNLIVVMLTFTLIIACMTAMAGAARTLFQAGRDGWMPRFFAHLNDRKVPSRAMWTGLAINAGLLLMSDYLFVLSISCVNYVLFHYLNLNAGWIHRLDNPDVPRPYRTPKPLFIAGIVLAYFNMFLIGAGSNIWGPYVLPLGLAAAFLAVPIFCYRHYVTDKSRFPEETFKDLIPAGRTDLPPKRCGWLPYLALFGGLASMLFGYALFWIILA